MDIAADLVAEGGVANVTFAALADRADYAPASLYTYFPSHSALVAALQARSLEHLGAVARDHVSGWNTALGESHDEGDPPHGSATITRLWAFAELFCTAPERHPREFVLQQELLVSPGIEEAADAAEVVPAAMAVLDVPRQLLHDARRAGMITDHDDLTDPLGEPLDIDMNRTLAWVVAMNGALLVDGLATGIATTGHHLAREITAALLRGWGAAPELVDQTFAAALELPAPDVASPERNHS